MGQRHQIYVKIGYEANIEKGGYVSEAYQTSVIPMHNQWFYGTGPAKFALNLINLAKKYAEGPLEENIFLHPSQKNKKTVAAFIHKHYQNATYKNEELSTNSTLESVGISLNPSFGDNNDGITVIDLSTSEPRYAFMFLSSSDVDGIPYMPLTANEYMSYYYDEELIKTNSYWAERPDEMKEWVKHRGEIVDDFSGIPLLSLSRISEIFPEDVAIKTQLYRVHPFRNFSVLNQADEWVTQGELITDQEAKVFITNSINKDWDLQPYAYVNSDHLHPSKNLLIKDAKFQKWFMENIPLARTLGINYYLLNKNETLLAPMIDRNASLERALYDVWSVVYSLYKDLKLVP